MTKTLSPEEATLWSKLEIGSENGKTSSVLTSETGFNRRKICELVESMRLKGFAIGALRMNRTGYFKIATEEERKATVNQLRKQAYRELHLAIVLQESELEVVR